jgi:hypothetical protein
MTHASAPRRIGRQPPRPTVAAHLPALAAAVGLALFAAAGPARAQDVATGDAASALTALLGQRQVSRTVTLRELGFDRPEVLASLDARREIYLPVPAGIPIADATLDFDARYLRAIPGRSTLLLSLDGFPVSARAFTNDGGDASVSLGVDGAARPSGFVQLGLAWSSQISVDACEDERQIANALAIGPDTRFAYAFDGAAVDDLATAWTALPARPVVLLAGRALEERSYDAAWRIGVALVRAGKRPSFASLPAKGDTVDLAGVTVPAALRSIPAYAALAGGGSHVLASEAEAGALLTLGGATLRADVAVADAALMATVGAALDALAAEVAASAPAASESLAEWRSGPANALTAPAAANAVRVASLAGLPVIAVAPEAGAEAAGLFAQLWHRIVLTRSVVARVAEPSLPASDVLPLSDLGGTPGPIEVLARGDWTATFGLGSIARAGRVPETLVVDVAAAPGATATAPVATVYLNDVLLGAKMLTADGHPERITARIPGYALAATNVLRVTFQRQPGGEHCRETPQAYPAAVLPTSHVELGAVAATDDFVGMIARYAGGADVIVPAAALEDATSSLPTLVAVAEAVGIASDKADLVVAAAATPVTPKKPFLSVGAAVAGLNGQARAEAGRLIVDNAAGSPVLDISGLDDIGVLDVVRAGEIAGVAYATVGREAPAFEKPIRLGRGDVAIVGPAGVLAEVGGSRTIETSRPLESLLPAGSDISAWLPTELQPVVQALPSGSGLGWAVPLATLGVLLFLLLLVRAAVARRKARKSQG